MTSVTDGVRCYDWNHLLTGDVELYAHDGGILVLWDEGKRKQIAIEAVGMTANELERAIVACNTVLEREEEAPVNRAARRAMN